ncbi:ribonuclease H-like protein [Aureobasidium pullulans]|nr:ribonuclease H-like protein [Aureobasidium pullulans]
MLLRQFSATMPESRSKHPLVWIDCEMTGLDLSKDTVMSLCCFITDAQLNILDDQGYEAVIHHSKEQLDAMGEWCTNQHGKTGLTAQCLESEKTAETVATELLEYIQKYCPERKKALLAGNTVHADRAFLVQQPYTPVMKWLHHRILDVSAIKEAAKRWAPVEVIKKSPGKAGKHEARADILESIAEARYYQKAFFQNGTVPKEEPEAEAETAEVDGDAHGSIIGDKDVKPREITQEVGAGEAQTTVQSLEAEGFGATSGQQDLDRNGGNRDLAS